MRTDISFYIKIMSIIVIVCCSVTVLSFIWLALTTSIKATIFVFTGFLVSLVVWGVFYGLNTFVVSCMKRQYKVSLFCVNCQKYRTVKNYRDECRKCGEILDGNVRREK